MKITFTDDEVKKIVASHVQKMLAYGGWESIDIMGDHYHGLECSALVYEKTPEAKPEAAE